MIAATGYRTDLTRLEFLPEAIRSRLRTVAGSPVVGRDYQSSVPGLVLHRAGSGTYLRAGHALRLRYLARRARGRPPSGGLSAEGLSLP